MVEWLIDLRFGYLLFTISIVNGSMVQWLNGMMVSPSLWRTAKSPSYGGVRGGPSKQTVEQVFAV